MTPDQTARFDAASRPVDWSALFQLAGLPMEQFRPIRPVRAPPMYADSLAAWEGTYPENPAMPIRVEGASLGGRVVFFEVVPPLGSGLDAMPRKGLHACRGACPSCVPCSICWRSSAAASSHGTTCASAAAINGAPASWSSFVLFLGLLDWLLGERHVAVFTEEVAMFYLWMARATLTAAIAWVSYFAVEPYVRRYWPQIMITWSRLLGGKFRDPLVGRDILIGGMCGILLVLVVQLGYPAAFLARIAAAVAKAAEPGARSGRRARAAVQARAS